MPGLNRTGPRGLGPMTGGGFGCCAGYQFSPYSSYGYNQSMIPQLPYTYLNNMQNPYVYNRPTMPMQQPQQPYDLPYGMGRGLGLGWNQGFGMGMAYRRGIGRGAREAYWF